MIFSAGSAHHFPLYVAHIQTELFDRSKTWNRAEIDPIQASNSDFLADTDTPLHMPFYVLTLQIGRHC
jgi:hypothetical protein